MNGLAKFLLSLTSLAPMVGAIGLRAWLNSEYVWAWICLLVVLVSLLVCWRVLDFAKNGASSLRLCTTSVKVADKDVLAFLLTYMLPLMGNQAFFLTNSPVVSVYVFLIVLLAVYHSNTFHFNPFLSLIFGYHFYEIELAESTPSIVVSQFEITSKKSALRVVELSKHLYIAVSKEAE